MTIHYTFWASAMFVAAGGHAVFHAEKKGFPTPHGAAMQREKPNQGFLDFLWCLSRSDLAKLPDLADVKITFFLGPRSTYDMTSQSNWSIRSEAMWMTGTVVPR
jgi:hypothetical protein